MRNALVVVGQSKLREKLAEVVNGFVHDASK
jgi:hypothetical protein